jgi:putative flippase GtrA
MLQRDIRGLLVRPTTNRLLQFIRACLRWRDCVCGRRGLLWAAAALGLHYLLAAVLGFIVGVTVNYILSKLLVFKNNAASVGRAMEVLVYVLVSAVGLGLTELFMAFFTEKAGLHYMLSKVVSALLVFIWNYYSRRVIIYREKKTDC